MASTSQLTIIHTSPATTPGALDWPSWQHLTTTGSTTLLTTADHQADQQWQHAFEEAGVATTLATHTSLVDWTQTIATIHQNPHPQPHDLTWFVRYPTAEGFDTALAQAIPHHTNKQPLQILGPQQPLAGEQLLDLVYVLDRIVGPQGCPWAQEQDHTSLAPYALEEVCELLDAINSGNQNDIAEELGDVLLQVVFHCAAAQRINPTSQISIDHVAARIADKMRRRRPHVFATGGQENNTEQARNAWAEAKAAEKSERTSCVEGVANSMPALAKTAKILDRASRAGILDQAWNQQLTTAEKTQTTEQTSNTVGHELLTSVYNARAHGIDAELALRSALAELITHINDIEKAQP